MTDALHDLARHAGVATSFHDQMGEERRTPPEVLRAVLGAMHLDAGTDETARATLHRLREADAARRVPRWQVVAAGSYRPGHDAWRLQMEDGRVFEGRTDDTVDLPVGYNRLRVDTDECLLMTVPPRPAVPPRSWGVTLPLYGLRTADAGGIGDYADLARAVRALGNHGASFVGINPIHAGFPEDPHATSPYSPSHRRRLNVLHIATHETDAAGDDLVHYPAVQARKKAALEAAWEAFREAGGDPAFDAWREDEGEGLHAFAVHQALSERHGAYWSGWPTDLQAAASPAVRAFAHEAEERIAYHAWLQWRAASQLAAVGRAADEAGMRYGLYLDLAVGTHPHGAETWAEPDAFARGVSLGAPPDAFSAEGQKWGLAPLTPGGLEALQFRPLIETLRTQLRYARLLRIDHILGFDRAFWVPDGMPGTYVRMPREAMLAVARIEAYRADAVIVGEDLGNVPPGLQEGLAEAGLLGCRLAMFERGPDGRFRHPEGWEERAMASFTTHDLPTFEGWRAGRDIDWRLRVGDIDADQETAAQSTRRDEVARFESDTGGVGLDPMHAHLGRLASALVALPIEDILGLEEQPNLPGTTDQHPNWQRRLPLGPAELEGHPAVARAAEIMARAGR
jgi:4-alpha-glucanotransferase